MAFISDFDRRKAYNTMPEFGPEYWREGEGDWQDPRTEFWLDRAFGEMADAHAMGGAHGRSTVPCVWMTGDDSSPVFHVRAGTGWRVALGFHLTPWDGDFGRRVQMDAAVGQGLEPALAAVGMAMGAKWDTWRLARGYEPGRWVRRDAYGERAYYGKTRSGDSVALGACAVFDSWEGRRAAEPERLPFDPGSLVRVVMRGALQGMAEAWGGMPERLEVLGRDVAGYVKGKWRRPRYFVDSGRMRYVVGDDGGLLAPPWSMGVLNGISHVSPADWRHVERAAAVWDRLRPEARAIVGAEYGMVGMSRM